MLKTFPTRPWKQLLLDLTAKAGVSDPIVLEARSALGMLDADQSEIEEIIE